MKSKKEIVDLINEMKTYITFYNLKSGALSEKPGYTEQNEIDMFFSDIFPKIEDCYNKMKKLSQK